MNTIKHEFIELTPADGMVLTQYTEGNDIYTYSSTSKVYVPNEDAVATWKEISIEQDAEYKSLLIASYETSGDTQTNVSGSTM